MECFNNTTSVSGDSGAMNNPQRDIRLRRGRRAGGAGDILSQICLLSEVKSRQGEGGSTPAKCIPHS